jgi:purine catabolism regulator
VIELPVEDFVRKNELVLTTAIGCGNDPKQFQKFVQDVITSDAAALAVATGHHVKKIPDEVLSFAERHQFPIIEIPWEIRFSEITQSVLETMNNWQRNQVKRSEELQKELLNLFLSGASLNKAAEAISQAITCPVLILDKEGVVKGKSKNADDLLKISSDKPFAGETPDSSQVPNDHGWLYLLEESIIQFKIQSAKNVHGWLLLKLPAHLTFEEFFVHGEEHLLEHAITAAALWFQKENVIYETEMRLRGDFVWSLAKGEYESWDMVLSRAKSLNYNVHLPYVCILGSFDHLKTIFEKTESNQESYHRWLQTTTRLIEKRTMEAGEAIRRKVMVTYHHDRLIIFLEIPQEKINETVKMFLDRVENRLTHEWPGLVMSWGIGENHAGIKTFHDSYNDARIALEIGTRQKGPGHRSTYANTGLFRALISLANSPDIQEITLSTIGALIDFDHQRGLDLIGTLIAYIRHQGNVSQTARKLNLHRQSLLYRLRKIEALTGRSLTDPDDLFLLDLSVKLWTSGIPLPENIKTFKTPQSRLV